MSESGPVLQPSTAPETPHGVLPDTVELDREKKFRVGLGVQLYLILSGSVLLLLTASLVAYFSFREILGHEARIAEYSMPNLIDSVEIARQSATVVNGAFRLVAASSPDQHNAAVATLTLEREALNSSIEQLEARSAFNEQTRLIETYLEQLVQHLGVIQQSAARRLAINRTLAPLSAELAEINRRMEQSLAQALDDQGFYLVEGLRQLDQPRQPLSRRASEEELTAYRNLVTVNHQAHLNILLLDEIRVLSDRRYLPPLEERLQSTMWSSRRAYERLPDSMRQDQLGGNLQRLAEIGTAPDGIIALSKEALLRAEQEQTALSEARAASELLTSEVNTLVVRINGEAISSSEASRTAANTGVTLLVLLNVLGVAGAILFGWLFVWRYLLRRLIGLATAMRMMAGGDLEVPVAVGGNDEVTDMARALEVFRRYALEVQRLNLVEKLAREVDAKNASLEQALDDLKRAQQQIIAEEKLASLGQLTAGVAHEIKNPLNFIVNFSTVSREFADEIEELLGQSGVESEQTEEIGFILEDLRLSLDKILEHGKRADSIVRNMLEHSRGDAGEMRETDLNALLKQYVELAYHSLRAESPNFNLSIEEALDPDMGMLTVTPQELSRVFLNLATNACQALDEKLQKADPDFQPKLTISSRRLPDSAEFCIRDNGPGIREDLRKRIFEPFVTTKDGSKGTGLGLSLTSDIITRHGGSIKLDTEEGNFTEMCIVLPLEPPGETAAAADSPS